MLDVVEDADFRFVPEAATELISGIQGCIDDEGHAPSVFTLPYVFHIVLHLKKDRFASVSKFGSSPESAPQIIREVIPVERCLRTGGKFVDQAIALWFGWYDDAGGLPDWSAFQPFEHPQLLTHVTVTRRIDGRYAYVLLGESVLRWVPAQNDAPQLKLRGKFLDEVVPEAVARDVTMRSDRAYLDKAPNYIERTMGWNPGHDFVRYRALILPFECARDGDPRMLKIFDFETKLD